MKRLILTLAILLLLPPFVSAHPGRTASDSYLFCRANFDNRIVDGQGKSFSSKNDIGFPLKTKKGSLMEDFIVVAQNLRGDRIATIKKGFYNGNDFRNKSSTLRLYYVMGVLDGLMAGQLIDTDDDLNWLSGCISGMTNEQVRAIVEKYLKAHPEEWHQNMNVLVVRALMNVCPPMR